MVYYTNTLHLENNTSRIICTYDNIINIRNNVFNHIKNYIQTNKINIILYLSGLIIFSIGANLFILSNLGTDPLDVLLIGIGNYLPVSIGDASAIVSVIFLSVYSLWNCVYPPISSIFTTVIVGYLVDLWRYLKFKQFHPYISLLFGIICCSFASALIIYSGIGIRIIDLFVITLQKKMGLRFTTGKVIVEVILFTIGICLGGPFGIGTICFLIGVSSLIGPVLFVIEKFNNGLRYYLDH